MAGLRRHRRSGADSAEERHIPGAFEGETLTRRRFMTAGAGTAGAIAAASFTLPALGFALGPVFDRPASSWQDIGPLARFSESDYVPVAITIEPGIGEADRSTAYVRRHSLAVDGPLKDRYDRVIAISSRCAHVGCPVRYAASARSFICPCHGGVYDFRGPPGRRPAAASTRPLLHAGAGRTRASGIALQCQLGAETLLASRPWRAAGGNRAVPLSGPILHVPRATRRQAVRRRALPRFERKHAAWRYRVQLGSAPCEISTLA